MVRSLGKQLTLILLIALALRLGAAWYWQLRLVGPFAFGDSESYWELARSVAREGTFQYHSDALRVFRAPGYPMLLAPIFGMTSGEPSVFWARALSAACGTMAVGAVWGLGYALFDARTGLLAAAIAAVYPGAVATSVFVLSEAPFGPLMLAHLILWIAAWRASSHQRAGAFALVAGLAAGAAALVRPSWLLFTPFAVAIGLLADARRARHLGIGVAMLLGLALAMAPWWIRNARITGHFVPTTLQVGASLYDGLNPEATGASNMAFVGAFVVAEQEHPASGGGEPTDPFEYRLDRRLRNAAFDWAASHPGEVLRLAAVKLVRMWNFWPNEASFSTWPIRLAVAATYLPVLILAGFGAWRTLGRGWPYWLCWLSAVYFTALHVIFVSSIRYRQPPMLALIVLAAGMAMEKYRVRSQESGVRS